MKATAVNLFSIGKKSTYVGTALLSDHFRIQYSRADKSSEALCSSVVFRYNASIKGPWSVNKGGVGISTCKRGYSEMGFRIKA